MTEILLVDDDFALQRMVRLTLEKEGYAIRTADAAGSALVELRKKMPDMILLDVRLPDMTGFDLCRKLRSEKEFGSVPIIFLTSKGEEPHRVLGLEIGGDDYVVKPFSAPELLARIKAVLRRRGGKGGDEAEEEILTAGTLTANTAEKIASLKGKDLPLTHKEFDLLCLFLRKKRRALGRAFIMEEVWEREYTGTTRTVDTHVKSLRAKLGPLKACLQTVENVGYRWVDPSGAKSS